tara:strand:+ start:15980 stop:16483 length:504 start_codon:yes stop_codon:yes gene_type:complete
MDCIDSIGFGTISSITTILGLLSGFYVLDVKKIIVVSALFSLMITDPISDSYGIYISIKDKNDELAIEKFKDIFKSKFIISLIYLSILYIFPLKYGYIISFILGYTLITYEMYNRFKDFKIILIELFLVSILIITLFSVNNGLKLYKMYNRPSGSGIIRSTWNGSYK